MTKEELVALFSSMVSGHNPSDDGMATHEEILSGILSVAHQSMLGRLVGQDTTQATRILNDYSFTDEDLPVIPKGDTGFIEYKVKPMSLNSQSGVLMVYPSGKMQDALSYRALTATRSMTELYTALGHYDKGTYSPTPKGIIISGNDCKVASVVLVPTLDSMDWDDEISLPEGAQEIMFGLAKQLYFETTVEDKIDDGR